MIKNLQDYGDGIRGGLVTVEPETSRHELSRIFDVLEDDRKIALETAFAQSSIFTLGASFKDCLSTYDDAFVRVRYVYEDSASFRRVNISELQQLMKLTRSVAVSADKTIVASISTSGARTARGKHAVGKLMKLRSDMLFLLSGVSGLVT